MWVYILQGTTYGFAAAVQPGPLQTYLISQTLNNGWRRTLPAALAPLLSDGPIIALVLLVLAQVPAWFVQFLQVAGGLFVLYLAFNAFQAWRKFDAQKIAAAHPPQQSVFRAALVNLLNPAPYIYWSLVTGPILLTGWRESPANGVGLLAGFYVTLVACLAGIVALFTNARRLGPGVTRAMVGISAVALAGFGIYQLWLGTLARLPLEALLKR
jgi:threonine/homoserine/homoserine lactone efflux protein